MAFIKQKKKKINETLSKLFDSYSEKNDFSIIANQDWDSKEVDTNRKLGVEKLFNFVKDSLTATKDDIGYAEINNVVKMFLRYSVEIGHKQQKLKMAQAATQQEEGRSI